MYEYQIHYNGDKKYYIHRTMQGECPDDGCCYNFKTKEFGCIETYIKSLREAIMIFKRDFPKTKYFVEKVHI